MTLPKLALTTTEPAEATADAVIIGTTQNGDGVRLAPGGERVDAAFDGGLVQVLTTLGATGKAEEVIKVPTLGRLTASLVIAVGLGILLVGRGATRTATQQLARRQLQEQAVSVTSDLPPDSAKPPSCS